MSKKQKLYEILIVRNGEQKTYKLHIGQFLIGSADNCFYKIHDEGAKYKAVIQVTDKCLYVKALDPDFPFKNPNSEILKVTESAFEQLGDLDLIISKIVVDEAVAMPPLPVTPIKSVEKINRPAPAPAPVIPTGVLIDGEYCDIVFDEVVSKPSCAHPVKMVKLDFKDYIDPFEDRDEFKQRQVDIKETIDLPIKEKCLSIIHMSNGTVLSQKYYPMDIKRVHLSNIFESKNIFKSHDCQKRKAELMYVKDNIVKVERIDGYRLHKIDRFNKLIEIDQSYSNMEMDERMVLTKGTGQIIVKIAETPPKLWSTKFFDMDVGLFKILACLYLAVFLPLTAILMFVDIPNIEKVQQKKEVTIIYRKPKTVVKRQKVQEKKLSAKAAPAKVEKPKEKVVVKKVSTKKVVKQVAVRKTKPTKIKLQTKSPNVAKKITVKKIPKKPAKTYKFSTSSKVFAMVGSTDKASTKLKAAKSFVASGDVGSKVGRKKRNGKLGDVSVSVSGYSNNEVSGLGSSYSTRGLATKGAATTTYNESSTRVLGAIDPALIRKILREYIPQFRFCYQKELLNNPKLNGVFDLTFKINSSGKGTRTRVITKKSRFSKRGVGCIQKVIALIQFPKPKGGGLVDVKQPLNFFSR